MLWQLLLFTAIAGAAPASSAPGLARLPGALEFGQESTREVVSMPDTISVNEPFQIVIMTFGNGCEQPGDTGVVMTASGATLLPYDLTSAVDPGAVCSAVIKRLPHTVTLRFDRPGEALIRIWGRRIGADTPPLGLPSIIERRVRVK